MRVIFTEGCGDVLQVMKSGVLHGGDGSFLQLNN